MFQLGPSGQFCRFNKASVKVSIAFLASTRACCWAGASSCPTRFPKFRTSLLSESMGSIDSKNHYCSSASCSSNSGRLLSPVGPTKKDMGILGVRFFFFSYLRYFELDEQIAPI
uniref:hypothetical protein n=1 Tax=Bidens bipinnata TaxID=1527831 RepID=UPI001EDD848C|nr:hypothetical protein MFQ52_mgp63 [Bidens bipinnata]YP_010352682.1 hypothetical protein MFU86_mgp63 [Bidens biternata]UIR99036.1 hypothetical protein [Bidens bipinnata]UIR99099.1 hypothetical protein [Bidens biternata]UIR99161.1 hypothetical protein [Bidens biternata]UIR99280.1 hypothetical protein [Bidens bipinnata]